MSRIPGCASLHRGLFCWRQAQKRDLSPPMNHLALFRRLAGGMLILLLAALLLTWLAAPQVVVLLREGFPAQTWPAPGSYAQVQGAVPPLSPPPGQPAPQVARDRLAQQDGRALLMDQGGTLVVEEYAQGLTRDDRLNSYSLVKSLIGALTLRAVADGRIASLDDPLSAYLGAQAPDVTIRDALTMTSGLMLDSTPEKPMEDGAFSPFGGLARLHAFGLTPVLPKLRADPVLRGQFRYESVNTALLGAVLELAYDAPLQDTLSRLIWKPAGAGCAIGAAIPVARASAPIAACMPARSTGYWSVASCWITARPRHPSCRPICGRRC